MYEVVLYIRYCSGTWDYREKLMLIFFIKKIMAKLFNGLPSKLKWEDQSSDSQDQSRNTSWVGSSPHNSILGKGSQGIPRARWLMRSWFA